MHGRVGPIVAAAAVVAIALAGCGQLRTPWSGPSDPEILGAVSLTEADAAADAIFSIYPNGDRVAGETSLDLCFGEFPSESLRVGRLQVSIGDEPGHAWVSSEAILYSYPQEAISAMDELAEAVSSCPDEPVSSDREDRAPLLWSFGDSPDGDWPATPGMRRQAYSFTVEDADGESRSGTATYLQRGRMVLALYATPEDSSEETIRNEPGIERFVEVMSRRLAAIPESALDEPNPTEPIPDPDAISA